MTIWQGPPDGSGFALIQTVDVTVPDPHNPWGLQNVRGVGLIQYGATGGYVVTGSENGYLFVISVPDGTIMSKTVYNPSAQRGINSVAVLGQSLLVANCMVGSGDSNLWYYGIDTSDWSITRRDSAKLQIDPDAPQVFNFDVIWGYYTDGTCWFSSTEEGYLWMGTASDTALSIIGSQSVTAKLGSALGMSVDGNLAVAAYDLYEFDTTPGTTRADGAHPQRLAPSS